MHLIVQLSDALAQEMYKGVIGRAYQYLTAEAKAVLSALGSWHGSMQPLHASVPSQFCIEVAMLRAEGLQKELLKINGVIAAYIKPAEGPP